MPSGHPGNYTTLTDVTARRGGRRREVDVREVLQGVLYVLETGCQWRHLPKDFPPRSSFWRTGEARSWGLR